MRIHKSELLFLGYLIPLAGAGVLAYFASEQLGNVVRGIADASARAEVEAVKTDLNTIWALMLVAVIGGMIGIYPTIRRYAHEHGRLSAEAKTLSKKSETYQQAALTDPLTGLHNRRYFDDALEQYREEFSAIGQPLGLIVLDLDHFKNINDTYGHDIGDDVLQGLTRCLLDYTRYHDVVARMGGEEFAILAPNLSQKALLGLADRIRIAVSEIMFAADNVHFRVTASMGIALWDGKETSADFIKRADKNLYEAKATGRNKAVA